MRTPRWLDPKIPVGSIISWLVIAAAAGSFWVFTKDRNDVDLSKQLDKVGTDLATAISETKGQVSSLQASMNEQIRQGSVFQTQMAQQGKEIDQLRATQDSLGDKVSDIDGRVKVLEAFRSGGGK